MPESLSRVYYFGVLPALGFGLAIATESFLAATVFTLLFMVSAWLVQDRVRRMYLRSAYSNENLSFSVRRWTATLTDEGVRVSSDAAEILYRWSFIRQVFRGSRYVHVELTPLQKLHIPVPAFRDEQHIQQFIKTAQSHIRPLPPYHAS